MAQNKVIRVLAVFLAVGAIYILQANADAVDDYNQKCAGCHGEDGLSRIPIDGSDCSLKSIEEIVDCYSLISAHDSVEACDDTCILETNTYVHDELLLQIGKNNFADLCAQCHGDDGMSGTPIDGSACSLNSLQEIVDCYPGISAHDSIQSCDDTCVWHTNRYVFEELLGNADDQQPEEEDTDPDSDDKDINKEITVENDAWVHCFISTSTY